VASFPGRLVRLAQLVGAWMHPATAHRRSSEAERRVQRRAGLLSIVAIVTGVLAVGLALVDVIVGGLDPVPQDQQFGAVLLPAALVLVAISVFAPQSVFRTRNAARTREVLTNPSAPLPPWSSTTIAFDAVLVGALLAGVYFDGVLALAMFGLAFLARIVFQSTRQLAADPNARFHALMSAWSAGVTGAAAFVIVKPLIGSIDDPAPLWPLVFAALVATYIGLALNALRRWVNLDSTTWAFARDAVDTRRVIVALVSAGIAWLVSWTGISVDAIAQAGDPSLGTVSGLAVYLAAWLVLWYASIRLWQRDALRTLALWSAHQAEVVGRLADRSLDPELAGRAALRITTRMAASVFGATRAMTVLSESRGDMVSDLIGVDVHSNGPAPEPRSLITLPHLRMPLHPTPEHPSTSSVTVAGWLWPGWFMTRSRTIVERFTELATSALLTPVAASEDARVATSFDEMFTPVSRWPSLTAFEEAVRRMREQADASPQSHSLLMAVYAIDDFGALAGGKFEQVAVGQVMRLALGHAPFAGHDVFVAYEEPGRLWVALGGGPIIRNGIELLRGLQQHINDHGSVPSAKLDVDVHVGVSFGYAAHQVDDFTYDGLAATARERLATDQATRDPFTIDSMLAYDFTPADIIDAQEAPVTAVDVLSLLELDRRAQRQDGMRRFRLEVTPILDLDHDEVVALASSVGWLRNVGSVDASSPESFRSLTSRQVDMAAEGARAALDEVKSLLSTATDADRTDLPILAWMPALLLTPEAAHVALPNLATPFLDRAECARTVIVLDTIPVGSGQALRLLTDRGIHVAVTAGAAAGADPADLYGWRRWGIIFPQHVAQGPSGVDALTIQQTASAIASQDTHLIAVADAGADMRELVANNVSWVIDPAAGIVLDDPARIRGELLD
jgi:hypothetical protein